MSTIHTTPGVEAFVAPADDTRTVAPPQIDRDTYRATRGITAGVVLGVALWVVILTVAWLIFG
jgi:hypothetical protein